MQSLRLVCLSLHIPTYQYTPRIQVEYLCPSYLLIHTP